jgi:hypothetical protein
VVSDSDAAGRTVLTVPASRPLTGYKTFEVAGNRLRHSVLHEYWPDRVTRADPHQPHDGFSGALIERPHPAPHPDCNCGIPVGFDRRGYPPGFFWMGGEEVVGVVTFWGAVVIEPQVVRAEFVRLEAVTPRLVGRALSFDGHEAAKRLGVDLAEHHELEEIAYRYGESIRSELKPRASDQLVNEVRYRPAREAPTFRFSLGAVSGVVKAWSNGTKNVGRNAIRELGIIAIGDVFALDDDNAVAIFASVPAAFRNTAEAELRLWAEEDDWNLAIMPGVHPLAKPEKDYSVPERIFRCSKCGYESRLNWMTGPHLFNRGFIKTRCDRCGGRRRFIRRRKK